MLNQVVIGDRCDVMAIVTATAVVMTTAVAVETAVSSCLLTWIAFFPAVTTAFLVGGDIMSI